MSSWSFVLLVLAFNVVYLNIAFASVLSDGGYVEHYSSPLECSLLEVGDSIVKLTIHNRGRGSLRLFRSGTILDSRPIEKVNIYPHTHDTGSSLSSDSTRTITSKRLPFEGLRVHVSTLSPSDESFLSLANGENHEQLLDLSENYNLREGDSFDVTIEAVIPYASHGSNELLGSLTCKSQGIAINVDGNMVKKGPTSHKLVKRFPIKTDCPEALRLSFEYCQDLSRAGSKAVIENDSL